MSPAPGEDARASFVTSARVRLTHAARDLVDAVLTADASERDLERVAGEVETLVAGLRARARPGGATMSRAVTGHDEYLPRSPLVGDISPVAPPLRWEVRDGRVHALGVFPAACEGPPGYVHGGWVALAFDEVLGIANIAGGNPGMTGALHVRYRRPTPLGAEVEMEGWTVSVAGRRIVTRGTLTVDGALTAEAEGLFVVIGPERAREYFGQAPGGYEPA